MAETDRSDFTAKTIAEVEDTPQGIVKRWLAELDVADQAEKDWRKEANDLWELYEGEKKKANSFNIFWSTTETLMPAVYNSTPEPDVRRRFRDADPLGKAASQVTERALSFELDEYDFDEETQNVVLDCLVTGRGVPRIKYDPKFAPQASPVAGDPQSQTPQEEQDPYEKLVDETVECEQVQWDKFRRGPGKTWKEVNWVAFEHDFTYEMAVEKFGQEIADALEYNETTASENRKKDDKDARAIFKTTPVHEIWDRDQRRVLFIAPCYKEQPCLVVQDPLRLKKFYPCPRPLYAIKNSRTLVPKTLFSMYREQAKELDRVTARINKLIDALKVRGAYSANLPEIAQILKSDETDMIAVQNVSEAASVGGLDKAIWLMPIDKIQAALAELYVARDQIKQTIYEIIGIGDLLRGVTDPNETKGAQVLKSQWGSLRLDRLKREVQRMCRDILRLKAEVIGERFSIQTLQTITNMQLPMAAQKQQAEMAVQQALVAGAEPPPEAIEMAQQPSWEEVKKLLETDITRSCRIDVETDSTVAETIDRDMQGLSEVTQAIGGLIEGAAPAVQMGLIPPELVKETALSISRRARLGSAVEDAIEQIRPPQPAAPPPEEVQKGQQMQQEAQVKEQDLVRRETEVGFQQRDNELGQREAALAAQQEAMARDAEFQKQRDEAMGVDHGQFAQAAQQLAQQLAQTQQAESQKTAAAMGQISALLTQVMQATQQQLQAAMATMEQVTAAINGLQETLAKPKQITFTRGGPNDRITGATAEVVH